MTIIKLVGGSFLVAFFIVLTYVAYQTNIKVVRNEAFFVGYSACQKQYSSSSDAEKVFAFETPMDTGHAGTR